MIANQPKLIREKKIPHKFENNNKNNYKTSYQQHFIKYQSNSAALLAFDFWKKKWNENKKGIQGQTKKTKIHCKRYFNTIIYFPFLNMNFIKCLNFFISFWFVESCYWCCAYIFVYICSSIYRCIQNATTYMKCSTTN